MGRIDDYQNKADDPNNDGTEFNGAGMHEIDRKRMPFTNLWDVIHEGIQQFYDECYPESGYTAEYENKTAIITHEPTPYEPGKPHELLVEASFSLIRNGEIYSQYTTSYSKGFATREEAAHMDNTIPALESTSRDLIIHCVFAHTEVTAHMHYETDVLKSGLLNKEDLDNITSSDLGADPKAFQEAIERDRQRVKAKQGPTVRFIDGEEAGLSEEDFKELLESGQARKIEFGTDIMNEELLNTLLANLNIKAGGKSDDDSDDKSKLN